MAYNSDFRFEIIKNTTTLSLDKSGWTKEINLASYNDNLPKYYICTYASEH